ncbi:hypothetical protein ABZ923_38645 [Streptomyces sp. NPDC046881]|uniref:hypothetical protein n=1 Tax=Streptomyces sp. NPDC046881 TaxID=3155374 RepID=UPI0033E1DAB0
MSPNPWSPRALIGLAALVIVFGVGVAYCDNHDQAQAPADPCADVAYALPAGPIQGTKSSSSSRKNGDAPPARVSKDPRPAATAVAKPSPSTSSHRPRSHIDLDLDGC